MNLRLTITPVTSSASAGSMDSQEVGNRGLEIFVAVDAHHPGRGRRGGFQSPAELIGVVLQRVLQDVGAERAGDLHRSIGRKTVDDHHALHPRGEALKATLDMDLLVEGEDDHRDRQRGRGGGDGAHRLRSASSMASVASVTASISSSGMGAEARPRAASRNAATRRCWPLSCLTLMTFFLPPA